MSNSYYVLIIDGLVAEVITPAFWDDGTEIKIEDRYTPDFVKSLVKIDSGGSVPECNYRATKVGDKWVFNKQGS